MADGFIQTLHIDFAQAIPFHFVIQAGIKGVNVFRQPTFAPEVVPDIFKRREHPFAVYAQTLGHASQEDRGIFGGDGVINGFVRHQIRIQPERLAILAPENVQRPARQLLSRIPLTLTVVA